MRSALLVLFALACVAGLTEGETTATAPDPSKNGAIAYFNRVGLYQTTLGTITFFEAADGTFTVNYDFSGLGDYSSKYLFAFIFDRAEYSGVEDGSNGLFHNSSEPAAFPICNLESGIVSGILPPMVVSSSGTVSSSTSGQFLKSTGVDSIIGRTVLIWNENTDCSNMTTFTYTNLVAEGVIGYSPLSKMGSSMSTTATFAQANATASVYGKKWNSTKQAWDEVTGQFWFFQNGDSVTVFGGVSAPFTLGGVKIMKPGGTIVFGDVTGSDRHYAFGNPSQIPGVLGSLTNRYYFETGLTKISLFGANSIIGFNLTIFSQPDDGCTQPDGDVGAAMAWGLIGYSAVRSAILEAVDPALFPPQTRITECPTLTAGAPPTAQQGTASKTAFEVKIKAGKETKGCYPFNFKIQQEKDGQWQTVQTVDSKLDLVSFDHVGTFQFTCLTAGTSYQLRFITVYSCDETSRAGAGYQDSTPSAPIIFKTQATSPRMVTFSAKNCETYITCFASACGAPQGTTCNDQIETYSFSGTGKAYFNGTTEDSDLYSGYRVEASTNSAGELCFDWQYTWKDMSRTSVQSEQKCFSIANVQANTQLGTLDTAHHASGTCYECTSVISDYKSEITFGGAGEIPEPACTGGGSKLSSTTNGAASLAVPMYHLLVIFMIYFLYIASV